MRTGAAADASPGTTATRVIKAVITVIRKRQLRNMPTPICGSPDRNHESTATTNHSNSIIDTCEEWMKMLAVSKNRVFGIGRLATRLNSCRFCIISEWCSRPGPDFPAEQARPGMQLATASTPYS